LFTQVDQSLDHSQGGLGLGLTLVRTLVEMHGGSVQADSDGLGRGSEFTVRLPILSEPKVNPGSARSGSSKKQSVTANVCSRRVLVVDDNVSSAQSLAMILKLDGHDVQVAHDGTVALDAVRRFQPEAILMD